jgi:hypothetical protein
MGSLAKEIPVEPQPEPHHAEHSQLQLQQRFSGAATDKSCAPGGFTPSRKEGRVWQRISGAQLDF